MKKIISMIHLPTLAILLGAYVLSVGIIFCFPHRVDGFGRMNAYQVFARAGKVLSLGQLDRTFVDWYMMGPTLKSNVAHYNRYVARFILHLTPIYLAWFVALSAAVEQFRRRRRSG